MKNIWLYILVSAGVSYIIRATPLVLIRREIKNRTLRSFLYYVPYTTLAVMTFPAIMEATQSPIAGLLALLAGVFLAWRGASLFKVAMACCLVVLAAELFLVPGGGIG
ncbi:AzlD domain-containing protein [Oscillospiraceae bacterium 21-37]|jgi:branched-subunit amino acid transport protein|uniref:AzlD domain-containing protein n=1 Tax=Eubacteriales TaxID=186802 RepID=UPI00136D8DAD|nr:MULTISPECIES: AzlD domain-containing protein [unclassified Neglectibacter]MCI8922295.1 AzlD domain-containing protein [Acutalibacter sp.]MCI9115152.1 AzlD domain-containing protein [Acutalibacter sp.]NBI17613.1 AzlD domain-containing protein [Neglectibacter sp. 59]NBJ74533.1 AzlD domain-containing protein [Neglectibacter sp. X4]NCE82366.1 AzlD domain-containing protein [Neglectibacter sp. X58]